MKWEKDASGNIIVSVRSPEISLNLSEDPCTDSPCGRTVFIYPEKDFHRYPGVVRDTAEWESVYKIRKSVKRSINHIKDSFCLSDCKTQNAKTLYADLLLTDITQLITVVLADRSHKPE